MKDKHFFFALTMVGAILFIGLFAFTHTQPNPSSKPAIYNIHVDRKEILYSQDDRFYRVFTTNGDVYDIRDRWIWSTSGLIFGKIREGHICPVTITQSFLHCWKYPCIEKIVGSCYLPSSKQKVSK